jgi:hypothetical protein
MDHYLGGPTDEQQKRWCGNVSLSIETMKAIAQLAHPNYQWVFNENPVVDIDDQLFIDDEVLDIVVLEKANSYERCYAKVKTRRGITKEHLLLELESLVLDLEEYKEKDVNSGY